MNLRELTDNVIAYRNACHPDKWVAVYGETMSHPGGRATLGFSISVGWDLGNGFRVNKMPSAQAAWDAFREAEGQPSSEDIDCKLESTAVLSHVGATE